MPALPTVYQLHIPARDVRAGDVFTLHGHVRTASDAPSPGTWGSVVIPLEGGGEADVTATRLLLVSRQGRTAGRVLPFVE